MRSTEIPSFSGEHLFYEVTPERRRSGILTVGVYVPHPGQAGHGMVNTEAMCFKRVANLRSEIKQREKQTADGSEATLLVINYARNCESCYQYIEGMSPREHLQELRMQILEHHRQEFEERLEKDRRECEDRREMERRQFEDDLSLRLEADRRDFETKLSSQLEADRRDWIEKRDEAKDLAQRNYNRLIKRLTWAAVLIGAANVIAAVLAPLILKYLNKLFGGE